MRFDRHDRAILAALQGEGRLTMAALSETAGLSASACHRRVRALEQAGVIERYAALLKPEAVGRGLTVLTLVTLENQRRETMEGFEAAAANVPEIMECYLMTGAEDYLLRILVRDASDYERLHRERLSGLPGVTRLVSNIAMRRVFARTVIPVEG